MDDHVAPQQRADWLQDLFDTTSDLIQVVGADGRLLLVNRAWCERLGTREAEAIGRSVFEWIAPECRERCEQVFSALLAGEVIQPIECLFLHRDGRRLSLEGQLNAVIASGRPMEVRGIFRDVSERRQAEEALQRLNASLEQRVRQRTHQLESAQACLEEAQRLASVGHWEMNLSTGELQWSDEICRISGFDPRTVTPSYALFLDTVHPDDRDRLEAAYQHHLSTRQPADLRYRLLRHDGSLRHLHARWSTDFDADGRPIRTIGTSQDVTDSERPQRDLRESEAKLRSLFDSSPLGLVLVEGGERFGLANAAFVRISGLPPAALKPAAPGEAMPAALQDLLRLSQGVRPDHPTVQAIQHWQRPDGRSVVVQVQASRVPAHGEAETASLVWIQVEDISERLAAEEHLRLAAKVFHCAAEGIFLTDADGVIVDVNDALCRITGYGRAQLLGQTPRLFKSGLHPAAFYQQIWTDLERHGAWSGEIINRASDGAAQDMLETIGVVRDEQGSITNYVALLSDIRQLKAQQRELERLALHDSLTGLPNRILLGQALERGLAAVRCQGAAIAICYVDLDGFKAINDRHGHSAGDTVLQATAQRMQALLPAGDLVARLGGDEFVAILHGINPELALPSWPWLQQLLDALVEPVVWKGEALAITASIGVTIHSAAGSSGADSADALLRLADAAMYQAKRQGKNRYWVMVDRDGP